MAEGVAVHPCWGPARFIGTKAVAGVEFICCISVFDSTGAFCPSFDAGRSKSLPADAVIVAIGQGSDPQLISKLGLRAGANGAIQTDEKRLVVRDNVFNAGESRLGPACVVEAIADGRRAAEEMDRLLGATGEWNLVLAERPPLRHFLGREEGFASRPRTEAYALEPEKRKENFALTARPRAKRGDVSSATCASNCAPTGLRPKNGSSSRPGRSRRCPSAKASISLRMKTRM
jgi:hypothetical protein